MKQFASVLATFTASLTLLTGGSIAEVLGEDPDEIEITAACQAERSIVFTAVIGPGYWDLALEPRAHVSFADGLRFYASSFSRLAITGYKKGWNNGLWTPHDGWLSDEPWFPSLQSSFKAETGVTGPSCCFYTKCPSNGSQFPHDGSVCTSCPPDFSSAMTLLESPARDTAGVLTSDGAFTLIDKHGGSLAGIWITFSACDYYYDPSAPGEPVGGKLTQFIVYVSYVRPGDWADPTGSAVFRGPGAVFQRRVQVNGIEVLPTVKAVHHNSADVAFASPGFVDAGDIASIAQSIGQATDYNTNWWRDMNADGFIDMSDLSVWSFENANAPSCTLGKATPSEETDRILAWFGIIKTGVLISDGTRILPELRIVDPEQWRRAMADPYGYRSELQSIESLSWDRVKSLYR